MKCHTRQTLHSYCDHRVDKKRTYLTRVVRMVYVRLSSLSSVMVQVPGSSGV